MANIHPVRNFAASPYATALICVVLSVVICPAYAQTSEPIDQLIKQLDQSTASKRIDAVRKIAQYGQQASKATDQLIARLEDSSHDVRVEAAYAVSCVRTDDARVLAALVPMLVDTDEHVRYSAEWSIARISKELPNEQTSEDRLKLIPVLQEALKAFSVNEHQPRNRIAVELALSKLQKENLPESQPVTKVDEPPHQNFDSIELVQSAYEASDRLGRFLFVNKLADSDKYPDSLRHIVLTTESKEPDEVVLNYIMPHWGVVGQRNLSALIDQMPLERILTEADARLIQYQIPNSQPALEQLFKWASDRNQELTVRNAAIQAIANAKPANAQCILTLIEIVADENADEEIRVAAADSLGKIGIEASRAESSLLAALQQTSLESLQFAALDAVKTVAPDSTTTARVLVSMLKNESVEEFIYLNIIEACGDFGECALDAVPLLTKLLKHEECDIRGASAQALGKIGTSAPSTIAAFIERIVDVDEVISTKNRASTALSKIGLPAIEQLIAALDTRDLEAKESILRALAIIGPNAVIARAACLAILCDEQQSAPLRAAAASAVGAMGPGDLLIAQQVLHCCEEEESELVRAACLIAAAQIDPPQARTTALQLSLDPSMLVRASAAYSLHLCGESRMGFDLLLGMLNGTETDAVIRQTLGDFGTAIDQWLVEVANDTTVFREARLVCFSMACEVASPAWKELLPLVEDFDLGQEFIYTLEGYWHTSIAGDTQEGAASIETLLTILESKQFTPVARARLAGLLSPDGLGAAGDEEDWQGITLSQPIATSSLLAVDEPASAAYPSRSVTSAAPTAPMQTAPMQTAPTPKDSAPKDVTPPFPAPTAAARPATEPESQRSAVPIQPRTPIRAQAADQSVSARASLKEVAVFYGTNRSREPSNTSLQGAAVPVLATIAASFGVMLFSFVGLRRSGNRVSATISLFAMGFIAPMSFIAVQKIAIQHSNATVAYGVDYRAVIEYGTCNVSIPPEHQPGELEAPSLLRLEVKSDPNKHVMVTQVEQLSHAAFFSDLQSMQSKKGKNLLVFIHGYNVSFEDAACRTAQMANDLEFPGAPIFYSWPSQANWYGYATDHENIQLSVTQIKEFLLDLVARSGAETINLVAHSMGNVGLTEALKEIQATDDRPLFNQVVLAAPDIDANIFKSRIAPHIVGKAQHVTLYTSKSDLALIASRFFNHGQRVGDSGPEALLFPGIDTIDATAVDSSLLGHTYYGDSVSVLTDLGQLLRNQPISKRHYLQQIDNGMTLYWAFDPLRISKMLDSSVR